MCSASVLCPLCTQSRFSSIDALRLHLIRAANGPLSCPMCDDILLGLDKLTIHLFRHTNSLTTTKPKTKATMSFIQTDQIRINTCTETVQASTLPTSADSSVVEIGKINMNTADKSPDIDWSRGFICDICKLNYRSPELLQLHYRLTHENSGNTLPNISDNRKQERITNEPQAQPPPTINKKDNRQYKCHLCAKTFKMKGSLRVHLKVVHLIGIPLHSVSTVGANNVLAKSKIYSQQTHLQEEQRVSALELNSLVPISDEPSLTVDVENKIIQLPVTSLVDQSSSQEDQGDSIAMINASPSECDPLLTDNLTARNNNTKSNLNIIGHQKQIELEKFQNLVRNENTKIWDCDVCAKSFTTKYFLKKHKRLHTGEMPYTCEICARTFTFQQSYHKHLLYHSDEKPHACATCGRAFKELSTLHNHERIHSGEKPFKCEVCGKSFRQRVSFLVHTRIHTGVMPYKCEICLKNFRYKVSQRTHKCIQINNISETRISEMQLPEFNITGKDEDHQPSEKFIKAFLESAITPAQLDSRNSPNCVEIAISGSTDLKSSESSNEKRHIDEEAILSQAIDEIVVESCNKFGIGTDVESPTLQTPLSSDETGLRETGIWSFVGNPSLLNFEKMRLCSPEIIHQERQQTYDVEGGDVEDFPQFLID